jgi:glycosyltransferase involved in cell wall biosynthesis
MVKGIHFINGRFAAGLEPVDLSVVIACYNESEGLETLIREWNQTLRKEVDSFELITVNDGSTDGTGKLLDRLRKEIPALRVIHQLNFGPSIAFRRGIEVARGTYVLQLEASGRYEPGDFSALWAKRRHFDLVLAQRTHRLDSLPRLFMSRLLRFAIQLLFGMSFQDPNVPFRLFRRDAAAPCYPLLDGHWECSSLALGILIYRSEKTSVTEVQVPFRRRQGGQVRTSFLSTFFCGIQILGELIQLRFRLLRPEIAGIRRPSVARTP